MCKLLVIPRVTNDNKELVTYFIKIAKLKMTEIDNHGLGYATFNESSLLSGERWLNTALAFDKRIHNNPFYTWPSVFKEEVSYNSFGELNSINDCIIVHSRYATCDRTIDNTHPFVRGNTALIHNGIVNHRKLNYITSTCDSEGILNKYVELDVRHNPSTIQELFCTVKGSYACAVLTIDNDGNKYLDLFRNNSPSSPLVGIHIPEFNSIVYATTPNIIEDTCHKLGLSHGHRLVMNDYSFVRLNASTGEAVCSIQHTPMLKLVAKRKKQ